MRDKHEKLLSTKQNEKKKRRKEKKVQRGDLNPGPTSDYATALVIGLQVNQSGQERRSEEYEQLLLHRTSV